MISSSYTVKPPSIATLTRKGFSANWQTEIATPATPVLRRHIRQLAAPLRAKKH
jgi:hypothetical protein